MPTPLYGLYAITPAGNTDTDHLLQQVDQALHGGARLIQYRDKKRDESQDQARRQHCAEQLLNLTRQYQALLIINDDIQLAASIGADGVHLGKDDGDIHTARAQLGQDAIIGKSCYNRLELARQAQADGADYIAFGRFFPSHTKPEAVQAETALLHQARQELNLPIVAIGGITADNAAPLLQAGADMLAVVDAVFGAEDVQAAAHTLGSLFTPNADQLIKFNSSNR